MIALRMEHMGDKRFHHKSSISFPHKNKKRKLQTKHEKAGKVSRSLGGNSLKRDKRFHHKSSISYRHKNKKRKLQMKHETAGKVFSSLGGSRLKRDDAKEEFKELSQNWIGPDYPRMKRINEEGKAVSDKVRA